MRAVTGKFRSATAPLNGRLPWLTRTTWGGAGPRAYPLMAVPGSTWLYRAQVVMRCHLSPFPRDSFLKAAR